MAKRSKKQLILPGGISFSQQLKKLQQTDYMEFIRVYQNMLLEAKAIGC